MEEYEISATAASEERDKAVELSHGPSKWAGMTYEQGVRAALDWVLGDDDIKPISDQ